VNVSWGKINNKFHGSRPESVLRIVSEHFLCKMLNYKNPLQEELRHPTSLMSLVDACLANVTGQPEYWTGTLGKSGGKVTRRKQIQNPPPQLPCPFPSCLNDCLALAPITIQTPEVTLN